MEQRPAPTFGRKGPATTDMDRRREAFLAAERARREEEREFGGPTAPARIVPHKSVATAYIMWFLLGAVSGHRFYLGSASTAFAQISLRVVGLLIFLSGDIFGLYLLGAAFLWLLADAVMLPDMVRKANVRLTEISSGCAFA